ncbi:putative CFEM domain-containing protein [Colletotrichum sublineola]|uniref:Putative CFEM domain-containing protein n=1 Tax=Colletotrichum sublineola TaxID=1173701 RepID=A0A066XGJ6_COLSU|nr:putative CFEM domain-containing protein [Colletotrichum sublineola]
MKSSVAVAIALAGLAAAQTDLPTCAQSCVTQFTSGNAIAGCSNLDVKCICSNDNFLNGIACCLAGACPEADQKTAVKYAQNICTGAGVSVPDQVVCKTANASASGSQTSHSHTGATASATNTPDSSAASLGPVALLGGLVAALFAL